MMNLGVDAEPFPTVEDLGFRRWGLKIEGLWFETEPFPTIELIHRASSSLHGISGQDTVEETSCIQYLTRGWGQ